MIEGYCDQTGIQEEDTFPAEKAPVRNSLVHSTSRGHIKMLFVTLHNRHF